MDHPETPAQQGETPASVRVNSFDRKLLVSMGVLVTVLLVCTVSLPLAVSEREELRSASWVLMGVGLGLLGIWSVVAFVWEYVRWRRGGLNRRESSFAMVGGWPGLVSFVIFLMLALLRLLI